MKPTLIGIIGALLGLLPLSGLSYPLNGYGIAVLDLSDPQNPRYAEHHGGCSQNMGSVGKILSAVGLFQAMADTWPDDLEKRRRGP